MSHEDFKKIIDDARQILVGKLPNPQDQIDAITYALMYKFMSDVDDQSASLPGGKRTYFAGDYEKYGWHNLMRADGQDQLILYREAIEKMSRNSALPPLFREIFNGAMLKFNDPRTLRLFLKEMDAFMHGANDSLGDAYEYLLSLMGSQGGLGQFRTPRHIIKFIVDVVNPDKTDKILDPAAGTAGFLIEAYGHILRKHDGISDDGKPNSEKRLTSAELDKIHENFRGFDIDATMIRTARVNMYLHGFKTPDIIEHDSLTSEDYWQDRYDVILANPPFMSPKGGIQPHKKFGVQASRAEVLFVDYIASHLKPNGKAGIVVPEGIIFQGGTAYKQLRKNLVENSLIAVVSLPAGVFQPYSGVKTSVLILDNQLAKEREDILFIKVENDGLSLGTQRRTIETNDLPDALRLINQFKDSGATQDELENVSVHTVKRSEIANNGNHDLTSERYSKAQTINSHFPQITLGKLEDEGKIKFLRGQGVSKNDIIDDGKFKCIRYGELYTLYQNPVVQTVESRTNFDGRIRSKTGDVYVPATTTADAMGIAIARSIHEDDVVIGGDINIIRPDQNYINPDYLSWLINGPLKVQLATYAKGANILHLSNSDLRQISIVLPPIKVQQEIVTKIAAKQQAIDHARGVIEALERERRYFDPRTLAIKNNWPNVKLGDIFTKLTTGVSVNSENRQRNNEEMGILKTSAVTHSIFMPDENKVILDSELTRAKVKPRADHIIISRMNTEQLVGASAYISKDYSNLFLPDRLWQAGTDRDDVSVKYVSLVIASDYFRKNISDIAGGTSGSMKNISQKVFLDLEIPLPPIESQKETVTEFDEQERWLDAAKSTAVFMKKAISQVLSELWGD